MNSESILFAATVYFVAILTAFIFRPSRYFQNTTTRNVSIDGLRGFLALGVFIHHAAVWRLFSRTGVWSKPSSFVFIHFGETTVAFFFMITAFLYTKKLLSSKSWRAKEWMQIFWSRVFRLFPLYLVSILCLLVIVMVLSNWQLRVPIVDFLISVFHWIFFGITRQPQINLSELTSVINAGVIWSLRLEWLFYFMLPIIAVVFLRYRVPIWVVLLSVLFVVGYFAVHEVNLHYMLSFAGGMLAAYIARNNVEYSWIKSRYTSLVLVAILIILSLFSTANSILPKTLIFVAFTLIALGNDLFGVLRSSVMRLLGEICYSTYLLHGMLLFVVLYWIVGIDNLRNLSDLQYCGLIFSLTPILVVLSYYGFFLVERPFIQIGKKFSSN